MCMQPSFFSIGDLLSVRQMGTCNHGPAVLNTFLCSSAHVRVPVPSALAWTVPLGARFRVNDNPLRPFHLLELLADFLPFPLLCQIRRSKRNKFRFCFFVNTCSQVTGMCSAVRHFQQNRKPHRHSTTHFAPTGSKITESAKRTHASTNPDIEI
jgi:hypothetical protein